MPSSPSFDAARYSFLTSVPSRRHKSPPPVAAWLHLGTGALWLGMGTEPASRGLQPHAALAEAATPRVCRPCVLPTC